MLSRVKHEIGIIASGPDLGQATETEVVRLLA